MRDNLEQFIQDNRKDFDRAIPSLKVWADIDRQLGGSKRIPSRSRFFIMKIAASVLFLLMLGAAGGMYLAKSSQIGGEDLAEQFPEFGEKQLFYTQQVSLKLDQLKQYDYDSFVDEDLKELDLFIQDLREQLKKAPRGSEEKIINAMIQNYQTKLAILERVLERLQPSMQKEQNPKKHETIDI